MVAPVIKEMQVKITRFYFLPIRLTEDKTTGPMLPKKRRKKYFLVKIQSFKISLESINSIIRNLFPRSKINETHKVALYDNVYHSVGY